MEHDHGPIHRQQNNNNEIGDEIKRLMDEIDGPTIDM